MEKNMDELFDLYQLTIQTFDDSKERGDKELAKISPYNKNAVELLNGKGAGIFFSLNPQINTSNRKIENTSHFRGISLDLDIAKQADGINKEEIDNCKANLYAKIDNLELTPNFIIETKHGYQPIWIFLRPIPLNTTEERIKANEDYKNLIHGIEVKTGLKSEGDNLCRVLRLPDTLHLKNPNDPFRITITELNKNKVSYEEFCKIYPPFVKETHSEKQSQTHEEYKQGSTNSTIDQILAFPVQSALERLSGNEAVDYEQFTFKQNTGGTVQIVVNGKATGQWIDTAQNTIGGAGEGQGNPTIIQFVQWYGVDSALTH